MNNSTFNKLGAPKKENNITKSYKEFKKSADENREEEFPKLNDIARTVKFNHDDSMFGESLGLDDAAAGKMAAKFSKASAKARKGGRGYVSRTVEQVLPTLSPEEIAFCVGMVIKEKIDMERKLGGDLSGLMRQMGINPEDL
jgi:hypothetical protein